MSVNMNSRSSSAPVWVLRLLDASALSIIRAADCKFDCTARRRLWAHAMPLPVRCTRVVLAAAELATLDAAAVDGVGYYCVSGAVLHMLHL